MKTADSIAISNLWWFCHTTGIDFEIARARRPENRRQSCSLETGGRPWAWDTPVLHIRRSGRFGNNVRQIIHAVQVARAIGARQIHVGEVNVGAITEPTRLAELTFSPLPPSPHKTTFSSTFFYRDAFRHHFRDFDGPRQLAIASAVIAPMLFRRWRKLPRCPEDVLHIHIRCGDIFGDHGVHSDYIPPPLSYYMHSIRHFQRRNPRPKIVLLAEDDKNPCIEPLSVTLKREGIGVYRRGSDFESTVGEVLSAHSLVVSVGSFAPMIALASTNIRSIYAFRSLGDHLSFRTKGTRVIEVRDAMGSYIPRHGWCNSPEQRRQIVSYPATALKIK